MKLSTPSLGITSSLTSILTIVSFSTFQLPLSGSQCSREAARSPHLVRSQPFNSLSRDHAIRSGRFELHLHKSFQLPLSGSLAIVTSEPEPLRDVFFQLPLSGSLKDLDPEMVGTNVEITFNSLSRDHISRPYHTTTNC